MVSTNNPSGVPALNVPFVTLSDGRIAIPWYRFMITLFNRTGGTSGSGGSGSTAPAGTIQLWGGTGGTVPDGYLLCDGSVVSRTVYSNLYNAIGVTWGNGDGSSTFGLPNLHDRVPLGAGDAHAPGATGGSNSTTIGVNNLPAHNHPVNDGGHTHSITDPGHNHTINDPGHHHSTAGSAASDVTTGTDPGGFTSSNTGNANTGITINSNTTGVSVNSSLTGITTGDTGLGTAINITPAFAAVLYIIKT